MFVRFFFVFLTENLHAKQFPVDKKLHLAWLNWNFNLHILINCEFEQWSSKTLEQNS